MLDLIDVSVHLNIKEYFVNKLFVYLTVKIMVFVSGQECVTVH